MCRRRALVTNEELSKPWIHHKERITFFLDSFWFFIHVYLESFKSICSWNTIIHPWPSFPIDSSNFSLSIRDVLLHLYTWINTLPQYLCACAFFWNNHSSSPFQPGMGMPPPHRCPSPGIWTQRFQQPIDESEHCENPHLCHQRETPRNRATRPLPTAGWQLGPGDKEREVHWIPYQLECCFS